MVLAEFQRKFLRDVYDNPAGTRRAFLTIARKNGKSALIAALLLAHLVGPEARLNSQIVPGALIRDQVAQVHGLAVKMELGQAPRTVRVCHDGYSSEDAVSIKKK